MVNKEIFESYLCHFEKYINDIPVNESFKNKYIIDDFDSPAFYYYFPQLFSNNLEEDYVIKLSISGFLIYKAIIYNDVIIDNHHSDINKKNSLLIKSNIYYEEAIKLLSSIIDINDNFWKNWYFRKIELLKSIEFEKKFKNKSINLIEFEQLAKWKCAIGKLAIEGLLSKDIITNEEFKMMCLSHDYFSCALQILDDITDLKKDYISGQPNIAISTINSFLEETGNRNENLCIELIEKYFFVSKSAEKLYKIGINYLDKAEIEVSNLNLIYWNNLIQSYRSYFISSLTVINTYLKQINAKGIHSNKLIKINRKDGIRSIIESSISITNSYILNLQQLNGSWEEFVTSASVSDLWSTSFIINNLTSSYSKESKDKAIDFILKNGLNKWGYKIGYPYDSDSSNFAILALLNENKHTEIMFNNLFEFQNSDGGFGTYNNININALKLRMGADNNSDFTGWKASHMCVSAVTLKLLLKTKFKESKECNNLKIYLKNKINENGFTSYWWTSKLYTISMLIECLQYLEEGDFKMLLIDKIDEYLQINYIDPILSDTYGKSYYYTGLLLNAILKNNYFRIKYLNKINLTIINLIENQYTDGSWKETAALRIPPPVSFIDEKFEDYKIYEMGVGVRAPEFNRLFTSSIISKSFENYLSVI